MSSFKKRVPAGQTPSAPSGTRVSAYNSSLLLSTGIASLDDILGGGCPVGSILLLEEDRDTSYAKLLLKYWIAQGICCPGQRVLLAASSLDQTPGEIVSKLPFPDDVAHARSSRNTTPQTDDEDESMNGESMKIAFRYDNLKKFETSVKSTSSTTEGPYCSTFDLTKTMNLDERSKESLKLVDVTSTPSSVYGGLLNTIAEQVQIAGCVFCATLCLWALS